MPRFLTPTKICLLILVDLYASDEIPAVARLDVLSLIASHVNPPSEYDTASLDHRSKVSSSDITYFSETLSPRPSGIPGRTLNDVLLRRVWELPTLDSLHELFKEVTQHIAPSNSETPEAAAARVSRASPLGQFIRRCNVEFTRLQFSDSQALWTALSAYRAPSYQPWASRNPEAARQLHADQPAWATASPSSTFSTSHQHQPAATQINTSADDTSTILSLSIHQLQKLGTRVPPPLKRHLSTWINDIYDSSAQSVQHFIQFFECWRAGQYEGALEGLHRYFDYSLVARGADGGALPHAASGGVGGEMRTYYQYALLHLSVLHADFERWGECVDALGECIGTGMVCSSLFTLHIYHTHVTLPAHAPSLLPSNRDTSSSLLSSSLRHVHTYCLFFLHFLQPSLGHYHLSACHDTNFTLLGPQQGRTTTQPA